MAERRKIDLSKSKLVLEKSKREHERWQKKITGYLRQLGSEQMERKNINAIRKDFFLGNQSSYTNIIGLQKKEKRGHANATFNYAGKTCIKLYYGMGNNPPKIKVPGLNVDKEAFSIEAIRAQATEEFQDHVFMMNRFWTGTYRRAVMNQIVSGGAGIKVFYEPKKKEIKIVQKENTDNLYIGWSGDDVTSYDFVIERERRTVASVEKEFGITILTAGMETDLLDHAASAGSHETGGEYGSKEKTATQSKVVPSGKTQLPKIWVTTYWDETRNMILVNDMPVQYVLHEWGFNPWVIVPNITVPNKPWGLSDIDFLIDPQIEYNETSNDTRDFIRAATNAKYVARNMPDFDPESIKTGSGQVVFVQGEDASFEAMPQPVNTFPADTYLQRIKRSMHDMGVPEVTFGGGQSDSGRAKAIDYQSMVDVIEDKRQSWDLALQEITERIQILGQKYFKKDFWINPETDDMELRPIELDWNEITPLTSSERITNIVNKYQSGLISLHSALGEAGYKNVEKEIDKLKQEESDPELAPLRHKVVELIPGIKEATQTAQAEMQAQGQPGGQPGQPGQPGIPPEQATPTLTSGENQGQTQPMALPGSNTSFSSADGFINRIGQNLAEAGQG